MDPERRKNSENVVIQKQPSEKEASFLKKICRENKHRKRYSTWLVIIERKIKSAMRCHSAPIRIWGTSPSGSKDEEQLELSDTAGRGGRGYHLL